LHQTIASAFPLSDKLAAREAADSRIAGGRGSQY